MSAIHITDIESAINHWRAVKPSPDGVTLASELRALAEVYALMIYHHQDALHRDLLNQPRRPAMQRLWSHLRRGAALA